MAKFQYTAYDSEGKLKKGVLEADDEQAATIQLRNQSLAPTSLTTIGGGSKGKGAAAGAGALFGMPKVKTKALCTATRQLATLIEAGLPVVGLGIDASVLYAHRQEDLYLDDTKLKRDYLDIPLNVKYKIQIPVLCKIITPFVTTGPDFSLLLGDTDKGDFKTRKWNTSWNVGFGAELFRKVQIHANYGIGLTKAFEYIGKEVDSKPIKGKDKLWTITAAYLF